MNVGDVRGVGDWNGARVRVLDGGGQVFDDLGLMRPNLRDRFRRRLDFIHQRIDAEVQERF